MHDKGAPSYTPCGLDIKLCLEFREALPAKQTIRVVIEPTNIRS